jgi:hypothetical protein
MNLSRRLKAAGLLVPLAGAPLLAADEPDKAALEAKRNALIDKQLDASLEARDIERILAKLKRASELSKTRIVEAAGVTEKASGSLQGGDSAAARAEAAQAAAMLQEVVSQLEALLKEETPQRLAAARDLAAKLAMEEREFIRQFPGALNALQQMGGGKSDPKSQKFDGDAKPKGEPAPNGDPMANDPKEGDKPDDKSDKPNGGKDDPQKGDDPKDGAGKDEPKNGTGKDEPKEGDEPKAGSGNKEGDPKGEEKENPMGGGAGKEGDKDKGGQDGSGGNAKDPTEALAERAAQLAERAATLADVINSIRQSADPADKDAVDKLNEVLKETGVEQALAAIKAMTEMIKDGKLDDARLAAMDAADRLEMTAQKLDAAYRLIIAPKAEELRKAEMKILELREELQQMETKSDVMSWHRDARQLLDDLPGLGVNEELIEKMQKEMEAAGFGQINAKNTVNWAIVNDRYAAPDAYATALIRLEEDLQKRLEALLLGDLQASADDTAPPAFREFVDRYREILSQESRTTMPRKR